MAIHRTALRRGASLVGALLIAATVGGGAIAASSGSSRSAGVPSQASRVEDLKSRLRADSFTRHLVQSRHVVNVKRLAARKPTTRKTATIPHLGRQASTATPSVPDSKVGLAVAPTPIPATTNGGGPAAQASFAGLSQLSGPLTNTDPPDPWVAVGPEHVVQAVNLTLRMTDRQGTSAAIAVSLPDFFGLPTSPVTFDSDPHVIYDSLHGRWLATEVSWDCDTSTGPDFGTGYIDFAVSRTTDPTGTWDVSFIPFPDEFPDFPAPGTSSDKVGIASNLYDMSTGPDCLSAATLSGGLIDYFDWADLMKGGGSVYAEIDLDSGSFTPRVALQAPATSPTLHQIFMANTSSVPDVFYQTIVGSVVAGTLDFGSFHDPTFDGTVGGFLEPPQPDQPGPDTIADAVDGRPTDAIWQNNRLVFVSTYPCSGDDCVRVTELNTAGVDATHGPTLTQDFLVHESGKDIFMGGIGLAGNGTLHVAWTRSSASDDPSSYAAHQSIGDAANSISAPELLGSGTGPYGGERWGDYVGVAQDPQVPSQAWNGNQYSGGTEWLTKITPLRTAGTTYVPITAVRVLDTRLNTGLPGPFSANAARTWQVTNGTTIPTEAVAVTGNVTVTGQTAAGYVAVTVTPTNTPPSSAINFPLGDVRANNITSALSSTGSLSAVFKSGAGKKTQLVFDVTGYFLADDSGATFTPLATPVRVLSSGSGVGLPGKFVANTPRTLVIGDGGTSGVPTTATAVTGNLAIVKPSKAGYASVTKDPTATPATSTINFPTGSVRANGVFATLDGNHALSIVYKASAGATTDVVLDITGYFEPGTAGLRFVPMAPSRIMDSRSTAVLSGITGAFTSSAPKTLEVQGHWGVPASAQAVTGNLSVTGAGAAGFVSATPNPTATPATSTLNFPKGDTIGNGIVAPLNGSGESSFVYKASAGKTAQLILDLSGYFE